jgi:NAD-dependent dihydropyrimidine dehydrogenase PreA subunit
MPHPIIDSDECSACGICLEACPNDVLEIVGDSSTVIDEDACTGCGNCMEECPMGAIVDIADE